MNLFVLSLQGNERGDESISVMVSSASALLPRPFHGTRPRKNHERKVLSQKYSSSCRNNYCSVLWLEL